MRAGAERPVDLRVALEVARPLRHLVLLEQPREDLRGRQRDLDAVREASHRRDSGPRTGRERDDLGLVAGLLAAQLGELALELRRCGGESCLSASAIGSGRWTQSASGPSGLRPSTRTGWPGLPTTVEFGGTSWITTALAPILAPWPIVIGPSSFAPEPIVTLSCTVGMALAGREAGAAERHALVHRHVLADLGGLADHDAHAVVDEQPVADLGRRMDLDPGQRARDVGQQRAARPARRRRRARARRGALSSACTPGQRGEDLGGRDVRGGRVALVGGARRPGAARPRSGAQCRAPTCAKAYASPQSGQSARRLTVTRRKSCGGEVDLEERVGQRRGTPGQQLQRLERLQRADHARRRAERPRPAAHVGARPRAAPAGTRSGSRRSPPAGSPSPARSCRRRRPRPAATPGRAAGGVDRVAGGERVGAVDDEVAGPRPVRRVAASTRTW